MFQKFNNERRILVIAAHPDDEVLGCGGTIARLVKEEFEFFIAILGEGVTSRYQQREQSDKKSIESLHNQSRKVAEMLGVRDIFLYGLPDNRFDTLPLLDVVKIIEKLIDHLKPQEIYTHHSGDLNIDHAIVHRAVLTATRPVPACSVQRIYTFEVPSTTEWGFGQFSTGFQANVFVDISVTLEKKIDAMAIYESEIRIFPHPRSPEALRALAMRRGSVVGLKAAEAFQLIREIRCKEG